MPSRLAATLLLLLFAAPVLTAAQEPAPSEPSTEAGLTAPTTGRVAVPEPSAKALRYYRTGTWWWWGRTLFSLAVPALVLFTGLAARLRTLACRVTGAPAPAAAKGDLEPAPSAQRGPVARAWRWFLAVAVFILLYTLIDYIVSLPLDYFGGFVRGHAYDLSNQTLGKWFGDSLKGLALGILASSLFLWIPYLLIEKSPRRWWLYTGLALVPFIVVGMLVTPIWIDPLFNDFGPMKDKQLESRILATAERAGIEGSRVFEVDKSVDTNAVNAYVTGFGDTKRIVLWDTILAKLEPDQVVYVMGHEMGHYALHHVVKGIGFYSLLLLAALYMIYRSAGWFVARWGGRFGFHRLHDIASLPLAMLLLGLYGFALTPLALAFSRHSEHEADRFGLELTRDNHAAASAFARLQEENLGNPRPGRLYKIWRASHPPLGERIDFCNDYRPWETGEALRYSELIDR
jgi:Zn-dependent protease with chaperone function